MKLQIFLVVIVVPSAVATGQVVRIINQLSESLKARSLVFYEFRPNTIADSYLKSSRLPFLVVTKDSKKFRWRYAYNSDILSVVFVKGSELEVLRRLRRTLWQLQGSDIIFIGSTSRKLLFDWCWRNGFYNVLLTHDAEDIKLWTYHPFPRVQSLETTVDSYLEKRNRWKDFQGYPIRIAFGNHPPFALVYSTGKSHKPMQASGTAPLIVELFTRNYNATLVSKRMPDFYSILDCHDYLRGRRVDMCADVAAWIPGGLIQITQPQRQRFGYIMVRYDQPIEREYYIIHVFNKQQWLLIVLSWTLIWIVLSVVHRHQRGTWDLSKFMMEAMRCLMSVAFNLNDLRGHTRTIIIVTLIVGGFMLSNYFLAYLSSILIIDIYDRQIESFEDLVNYNIYLLTNYVGKAQLTVQNVSQKIIDQVVEAPKPKYEQYRSSLNTEYAYTELLETCLFYMEQQKFLARPKMKLLPDPLYTIVGGSPIASNWPFEDMVNRYISYIYEFGFVKHVEASVVKEAIDVGILKYFPTEARTVDPLSLDYIQMPILMLCSGYAMGLIVFLLELIMKRWK